MSEGDYHQNLEINALLEICPRTDLRRRTGRGRSVALGLRTATTRPLKGKTLAARVTPRRHFFHHSVMPALKIKMTGVNRDNLASLALTPIFIFLNSLMNYVFRHSQSPFI